MNFLKWVNPDTKGNYMMLNSSIETLCAGVRLNDFVYMYIQRDGIAYVVDHYNPIREQYYTRKTEQQKQAHQWKEDRDV